MAINASHCAPEGVPNLVVLKPFSALGILLKDPILSLNNFLNLVRSSSSGGESKVFITLINYAFD